MLPQTIATSVSQKAISTVSRLFNGTVSDILNEMFQNARRAGASRIDITIDHLDDKSLLLSITDDGHGISDPASVFTLGRSDWDDGIDRREDPAGMGIFSLAGKEVTICSWSQEHLTGWRACISPTAWDNSEAVDIDTDTIEGGTIFIIRIDHQTPESVERAIESAALYFPLPVYVADKQVPRKSWLENAAYVEHWSGSTIAVFNEKGKKGDACYNNNINFYGLTIRCSLPHVLDPHGDSIWYVKVDLIDTPDLKLVLPARKEVVENDKLAHLTECAERAIYRAISQAGGHRLPYSCWRRARALGVELAEAEKMLPQWLPILADRSNYDSHHQWSRAENMILVPDIEPHMAHPLADALENSPLTGKLFAQVSNFEGYSWYDQLARINDINLIVRQGGAIVTIAQNDLLSAPQIGSGYVDEIILQLTIDRDQHEFPARLAIILPDEFYYDVDDHYIIVSRAASITIDQTVDILEAAIFCVRDDDDSDSYDTQQHDFRIAANSFVTLLLLGKEAAIKLKIEKLLADIPSLRPEGTAIIIQIDDKISVSIQQPAAREGLTHG